jgi:hypothetical protein
MLVGFQKDGVVSNCPALWFLALKGKAKCVFYNNQYLSQQVHNMSYYSTVLLSGVRLAISVESNASKRSLYKTKQCSNTVSQHQWEDCK